MYLCRELANIPLKSIGQCMGNRDHTTIMHGCDKIEQELQNSQTTQKAIEILKKKMEKRGVSAQQINQQARMNARNIQAPDKTSGLSQEEKAAQRKKATEYYNNANVKPGSLAAKANMVKQFDEKNTKKK